MIQHQQQLSLELLSFWLVQSIQLLVDVCSLLRLLLEVISHRKSQGGHLQKGEL